MNDLYQGAVPALLPFMMLERGYSYSAVAGITLAATGLSSVVQPIFGMVVDRKHRGWLIPGGFLLAAAGTAGAGLGSSYWVTWLCMAAAGIGIAAYHPPATNEARAAGGRSQVAMSAFSVGGTVGAALAPPFVTLVVGRFGLSGSVLLTVPALVVALMWVSRRPWARLRGYNLAAPLNECVAAARSALVDDWRAFARLVLVTVCWSIPYVTALTLVSPFVLDALGGSTSIAALALSLFTIGDAVGTLLGGLVADRWGRIAAVRLGFALAPVALLGLASAPSTTVALVAVVVVGIAMFLPFAPQVTLAQDYLPNRPGTASGVTLGLAMSVGGVMSPAFGVLADHSGPRVAITASVAVLFAASAVAWTLRDRVPENEFAPTAEADRELEIVAER
ncbi:MFS transporter [Nocardia sp. NPDC059091]|uniref:MFS transporter n=1 Tax=Nocardia sp. NPDC059091 TaxID=3346724 RepID=UPI0036A20C4A